MKNLENYPFSEPLIFDTHSHYDAEQFDGYLDELLERLVEHGVSEIITCGCDGESSKQALDIAHRHSHVYAAVGIHPQEVDKATPISYVEELAKDEKCVAIGEIGLDYYWVKDNKELQTLIFEKQLELSNKLGLPVSVHDREAHEDTLTLLQKHKPKGVVHCFSGSPESAREIVKLGMYIGIGGVATFKNAKRLPEVIESVLLDRILLETDCPYLAPEPFRGKTCHSAMILRTAQRVAEIKGITTEELLKATRENAKRLFNI
ncbi:MAG: TatD family deoxyribonuclease [Ruminococcaceae bacterium]|nr:TatD family deoxyribonuclease [Oscillospiraceae bacterium]